MENTGNVIASRVVSGILLSRRLWAWRLKGRRIVFTNGCFDLLHIGHITYLSEAAALGDRLVVGLNSDDAVRRLKGAGRPVIPESARAFSLASLFFVDAVCIFKENTPYELIRQVQPDVLVKGADYTAGQIVGSDIVLSGGGAVKTIPYLQEYSTTSIVGRIGGKG